MKQKRIPQILHTFCFLDISSESTYGVKLKNYIRNIAYFSNISQVFSFYLGRVQNLNG